MIGAFLAQNPAVVFGGVVPAGAILLVGVTDLISGGITAICNTTRSPLTGEWYSSRTKGMGTELLTVKSTFPFVKTQHISSFQESLMESTVELYQQKPAKNTYDLLHQWNSLTVQSN